MSDTNRVRLAFVKETTYGEQVVVGNLQRLRLTGESLKQDSSIVSSEEIRDDRQTANIVRTSIGASGAVNLELSHETYDDLLAAALQSVNVRATGSLGMATKPITTTDTVTIGSIVYRFMDTPAAAYDVEIGALVADSQANLVAAINASGTPGVEYFAGTLAHPDVRATTFAANVMVVTAKRAGLDANAIATTETFTDVTDAWVAATLLGGLGWTASVTITAATISAAAADDSFNDSSSGFGAYTVGSWIYVSGFAAANNNGWFKVASATVAKIVVANGSGITLEAATPTVTILQVPAITNGVQLDTFNLEKTYTDLSNILNLYTGMAVNSFSLDVPVDGIITGSIEFLGTREQSLTVSGAGGYEDPTTTIPMATVNDFDNLFEGNADQAMINFGMNIANSLRQRMEAGTLGPSSMGSGTLEITGTLQVYFSTHTLMNKYLNHTESSLAIALKDASGNGYIIDLPSVRFTNGQRVAGGKDEDVIAEMEWSAFMNATEGKTIRIGRLDAA